MLWQLEVNKKEPGKSSASSISLYANAPEMELAFRMAYGVQAKHKKNFSLPLVREGSESKLPRTSSINTRIDRAWDAARACVVNVKSDTSSQPSNKAVQLPSLNSTSKKNVPLTSTQVAPVNWPVPSTLSLAAQAGATVYPIDTKILHLNSLNCRFPTAF